MKKKIAVIIRQVFFCQVCCALLATKGICANDIAVEATASEQGYSGSTLKVEDILSKSDAIFVGQIVKYGTPDSAHLGVGGYFGTVIKVEQRLAGSNRSTISATFHFLTNHVVREGPPKLYESYVFFAKANAPSDPDPYEIIKVLPASEDSIAKVKALIGKSSTSK